jgi:diguanylate cyclase (GGDEF)-like protein
MTPEQPPPPATHGAPQAARDALTGLADRDQFQQHLRSLIAHTSRERDRLAVVFIDLRGLEPIRQDHGDRAGDAVLVEFASRIRASARRVDVCARMECNGFAVILPHIPDRAVAIRVQDRLCESVSIPFEFEGTLVRMQAHCGIALFPDDAQDAESLLAFASRPHPA